MLLFLKCFHKLGIHTASCGHHQSEGQYGAQTSALVVGYLPVVYAYDQRDILPRLHQAQFHH